LLDEGIYLGSQSTFYRLLRAAGETRERRRQPPIPPPSNPNCWRPGEPGLLVGHHQAAWAAKWTYYHLYVILDIYSRYAVGWMVATRDPPPWRKSSSPPPAPRRASAAAADVHADRGSSMTSRRSRSCSPTWASPSPQPPARIERQPVLRGAVQDPQVPAVLPAQFTSIEHARRTARNSSAGTTTSTATPASAAHCSRRPPRPRHHRPDRTRRSPDSRLPSPPRAIRHQAPGPPRLRQLLDQPPGERNHHSVKTT